MAETLQLFLSCVSAEFRGYREQLRRNLAQPNLVVQIQEDFMAGGVPTLDKLDTYVKSCDAVIHLVGDGLGALAKPRSLQYLRETYPDLCEQFPDLAEFVRPDRPSLSYTQWEAWLALLHGRRLLICTPQPDTPREQGFAAEPDHLALQQAHLACLRKQEAYPEIVFSNADQLTWQIQRSINHAHSVNQGLRLIQLPAAGTAEPHPPSPPDTPAIDTLTLMVLVEDAAELGSSGRRYLLTPELHPPELNDLAWASALQLEARDNIVLDPSSSEGRYIGDCLNDWLTAARSLAQQIGERGQGDREPEVLLELFLPAELLLLDCGGLGLPSSSRKRRPMARQCCYLVRSLDRARDQVNVRGTLEAKWKRLRGEDAAGGAGLLLVNAGPPEHLRRDAQAWDDWHDDLYDLAHSSSTQACIYLPDPEADASLRQPLLDALIDAHVPLLLLWPGSQRSAAVPASQRLAQRLALLPPLLAIDPQLLPPQGLDPPQGLQVLQATLADLSAARLAVQRKELLQADPNGAQAIRDAASQAVLVLDVPDRWPRCLATRQISDQLRPPI